ncbi:MAG: hypothetical protein K0R38_3513 [Polyangiaceae bacterium]|jgi:hypothetical protein|nr:hypothetical protein [Polyangiaceae bacterium]
MLTLLAVSALSSVSVGAEKEAKPETADACVSFHDETVDKALVVEATNSCQLRLSCRLDYTVRCTDLDGKQTRKVDKRAPFSLAPKSQVKVTLSASTCQQGWRIDDFSWTCG